MRCGECEAAGLVEPCFCPCCGRPLTAVRPVPATAGAHPEQAEDHRCASCGAPAPPALELCDRCQQTFERVLAPSAVAAFEPAEDDEAPTLVVTMGGLGAADDELPRGPLLSPGDETGGGASAAPSDASDGLDSYGVAAEGPDAPVEPPAWWEPASVAIAAPPPSPTPWTGHFEAFPEPSLPAPANAGEVEREPAAAGDGTYYREVPDVEAMPAHTAFDAEPGDTPVSAAPGASGAAGTPDAEREPRPWWETPEPAPPVRAAAAMPDGEPPVADVPPPREAVAPPGPGPSHLGSRAAEAPAHRAAETSRSADAPPSRLADAPVRPPRPRPARPPRPVARPRRVRVGRLVSIAIGTSALCIVAVVGFPHAIDLVWRAPAPASAPLPTAIPPEPLPALPAMPAAVPDPTPQPPPPAVEAPRPEPAKPTSSAAERPKARPDAAAGGRAARLLQQKASAAQAPPVNARPALAEAPVELPRPAVADSATVTAPVTAPEVPTDTLGTAFEVTQVDVRPQVMRQVAPRRPDSRTSAEVVVVRVLVSPSGRAADVRVVRGARDAPAYDAAAVAAVKQWTFSPAQKRSRPVSCWVHVGVPFSSGE